jgi:hypothetical protein
MCILFHVLARPSPLSDRQTGLRICSARGFESKKPRAEDQTKNNRYHMRNRRPLTLGVTTRGKAHDQLAEKRDSRQCRDAQA